jgi:putative peptidoglycan lipid II flippase
LKFKQVSIVTLLTGVNLVVTLANQLVLAYLFGTGSAMDAFLACGAVPWVVLNLAIGDLGYVLVPLLTRCEKEGTLKSAVRSTFSNVLLLSMFVTGLGIGGHRLILHWTTSANMPAQTFEIAASLAPMMWVVIGLTIVGSYLTGLHYHRRQFIMPSLTLAFPYLGMIAGGIIGARRMGIMAVAVGWAAGTLARNIALLATLRGVRLRPTLNLRHPACRRLFRTLPLLGLSLLPFAAPPMIDVYWASRLPVGSISYLGYSNRIVIALTSIVVQGISVVLFPDLADHVVRGEIEVFRGKVVEAIKVILLVIIPLAMLVALARLPLVQLALQRGRFSHDSAVGVASVLPLYLLGTVWMALMNIVIRSFYALQNYRTPAIIGLGGLVLYTVITGLLIGPLSYLAIGVAYIVFWLFMFFVQTHYLARSTDGLLGRDFGAFLLKVSAAAAGSVGAVLGLSSLASLPSKSGVVALTQGTLALLLFVLTGYFVFRFPQYKVLLQVLRVPGRVYGQRGALETIESEQEMG